MADKIKELVAIGASVTAHCQPCLVYHVGKAREMKIDEQEIRDAIAVGHVVEKGSRDAMQDFAGRFLDSPTHDDSARVNKTSSDGKCCCT